MRITLPYRPDAVLDSFQAMEAAGVTRIVIPRLLDADREHALHSLQRLADDLLQRYRPAAQTLTT